MQNSLVSGKKLMYGTEASSLSVIPMHLITEYLVMTIRLLRFVFDSLTHNQYFLLSVCHRNKKKTENDKNKRLLKCVHVAATAQCITKPFLHVNYLLVKVCKKVFTVGDYLYVRTIKKKNQNVFVTIKTVHFTISFQQSFNIDVTHTHTHTHIFVSQI